MRHRVIPLPAAAILALTLFSPAPASAATIGTKLGRGLANTLTGWVEIPAHIGAAKRDDTAVLRFVTGTFEGIEKGLTRTLLGIWDLISFPVPPYDRPVLDPEILISKKPPHKTAD